MPVREQVVVAILVSLDPETLPVATNFSMGGRIRAEEMMEDLRLLGWPIADWSVGQVVKRRVREAAK